MLKTKLKSAIKISVRDTLTTVLILCLTMVICLLLRGFDQSNYYVSMLYVLGVFLIARSTNGYVYGIISSCISVLLVNYFFTYPYFRFNFTLTGYPITIVSMLAVSVTTSALTSQAKHSAEARLETEREKTRSNLLRAVSHDLRTPLTGILGASSAILENDENLTKEERLQLVQDIQDDAQWLIRMVENLLAITRVDAQGDTRLVKIEEPGEEVLEAAVAKFRKQHQNWQLTIHFPEELVMIPMDAVLIEQVLMNLLENVVDHGKGADRIYVSLEREGEKAVFTVQDNGSGIDPAVLPQIFSGHLSSNYGRAGDSKRNMGIGLSVCNTIVRAHNGTMEAKNVKEGGAMFRVVLPLEEKQDE